MGILEDDLQTLPQGTQLRFLAPRDLLALEADRALGRLDQAQQGAAERRLAGARLADDAEHLALAKVEADAVDCLDRARLPAPQPVEKGAA